MNNKKSRVVILGTGNIGTDLLVKVMRSSKLECVAFIGRNSDSFGMRFAADRGILCSDRSINYIIDYNLHIDLVFDATSAEDHIRHAPILKTLGIPCIDMTPAKIGALCVPAINMDKCLAFDDINMVTCGGQTSIPIAYTIKQICDVQYIEVVSSIASKSAGMATRQNLDEYIHTTEMGLRTLAGATKSKAILILNPAIPCIDMQTTIFAKVETSYLEKLTKAIQEMVKIIKGYVPGYDLLVAPTFENGRIIITIKVEGLGDYLPKYAGNLDIINCAAIAVAEKKAEAFL
jgi:acetaldehyde dehydrogenase